MKDKYDVIIIGAGIGGLVCGCYLAKAGLKVLIVEQHDKVGGYCTSFKRGGYTFDVGVHYLGAGRESGELGKLIKCFNLDSKIQFVRLDPCDKIITPDRTVFIRKDPRKTIAELKNSFPKEKNNIDAFFSFIRQNNMYNLYAKTCLTTFQELLDIFFKDHKLKSILSMVLGNIGLPASRVSALTAIFLYREYLFDGGYYPIGGMKHFSDTLYNIITELGSEILLSQKVTKIMTSKNRIEGIEIDNSEKLFCDFVISDVDAVQTFNDLLDIRIEDVIKKNDSLEVSTSAFVLFLSLNIDLKNVLHQHCTHWLFSSYDVERLYNNSSEHIKRKELGYIICTFPSLHDPQLAPPGKSNMSILIAAPFESKKFWDEHKQVLATKMVKKAEELIPSIETYIESRAIATPHTFYRYTLNRYGAMYGWASIPKQIRRTTAPQETCIKGLYSVGHWCTNGLGQGGVSVAAYSGRNAAKLVLKNRLRSCSSILQSVMES